MNVYSLWEEWRDEDRLMGLYKSAGAARAALLAHAAYYNMPMEEVQPEPGQARRWRMKSRAYCIKEETVIGG